MLLLVALNCLPVHLLYAAELNPALIHNQNSGEFLNPAVQYYIDLTDHADAAQVMQNARFLPTEGRNALGLSKHPVWLKADVQFAADTQGNWWVEYLPYSVNSVQLYIFKHGRPIATPVTGESQPQSTRPFAYRQYLWPLHNQPGDKLTLMWRIESFNTLAFPLRIWRFEHWSAQTIKETLWLGICFGVMGGLALYNLLLWFRLNDRLYLLYSAQILSYFFFAADLHGYLQQFVAPESIFLVVGRSQALTNLYGVFVCAFAWKLLDTPKINRWWKRIMGALVSLYVLAVLAALCGFAGLAAVVMQVAPMVWIPLVLGVCIYRMVQGYRPAWLYLIGYGPLLAGLISLLAFGEGGTDGSSWIQSLYLAAGAWEAILFSQALAWRIVDLNRQREGALEAASTEKLHRLEQALQHEAELERKVEQRTAALMAEVAEHRKTSAQLSESQQRMEYLAFHDPLTGLPNRRLFEHMMESLLQRDDGRPQSFVLAILDLDCFKQINDSLGHDGGDAMIIATAERLRQLLGSENDCAARLGGDEFALILDQHFDLQDVGQLRTQLAGLMQAPAWFNQQPVYFTLSMGLARYPEDGQTLDALYRCADKALYRAKLAGRNRIEMYAEASFQFKPGDTVASETGSPTT